MSSYGAAWDKIRNTSVYIVKSISVYIKWVYIKYRIDVQEKEKNDYVGSVLLCNLAHLLHVATVA